MNKELSHYLHSLFQTTLDSDFKCNTRVPVVGTDSRIKHLAFRSQVFFSAGGSTHLESCVSPDLRPLQNSFSPTTETPKQVFGCRGKGILQRSQVV